jgi:uncharacterized protein YceK
MMDKKVIKVLVLAALLMVLALLVSGCGDVSTLYIGQAFRVPGESETGSMICVLSKCWIP